MSKYYSSSIAFGANQTKTEKVVVSPTKIGDVTTDAVSGALTVDEVPTLDSLNPVSSDGVARAVIQAGAELPTRSSEDTGKVLKVANSAGDLEWANDNVVTVDQTYDASSTNAQSGTAVAEALGTETTLVAGSGISLTESSGSLTVAVDYDTNTLDAVGQTVTENVTQKSSSGLFLLPASVAALLSQQGDTQVTVHIPANTLKDRSFSIVDVSEVTYRLTLYATDSTSESSVSLFSTPVEYTIDNENAVFTDQDLVFSLPASVANQWSQNLSSAVAFNICGQSSSFSPATASPLTVIGNLTTSPITFTFADESVVKLAVKNPLPSFTSSDAGKVLQVQNDGTLAWVTLS